MGLIRSTLSLAFLGLFVLVGLTIPIGERTLFSHVANIWTSDEAQELVEGVKDSSGPFVDRVKRGVEAGLSDETQSEPTEPANTEAKPEEEQSPAAPGEGNHPVATKEMLSTDGLATQ